MSSPKFSIYLFQSWVMITEEEIGDESGKHFRSTLEIDHIQKILLNSIIHIFYTYLDSKKNSFGW